MRRIFSIFTVVLMLGFSLTRWVVRLLWRHHQQTHQLKIKVKFK